MIKIKLIFISHSAEYGGAEKNLLDIITNIDRDYYEVYLLFPREGLFEEEIRRRGIRCFIINYKYWVDPKPFSLRLLLNLPLNIIGAFRIVRLIKKIGIDMVYTNTCTVISGAIASFICGKPHLWHIHEHIGRRGGAFCLPIFNGLIPKLIHLLSSHIIVNSAAVKDDFPKAYQEKVSTIYYGFEIPADGPKDNEKEEIKRRYGVEENEKIISVIGVICDRKGQREATLALSIIAKEKSNFRLLLAGKEYRSNRPYISELSAIISRNNLQGRMIFTGFIEDIKEIYAISDMLLVPSSAEPFGRVVVEAMLYGVPVIATRVGGIPEIVEDGKTGILINSRGPEEIAAAILRLSGAPQEARRLVETARRTAIERFGMARMMFEIESIIKETWQRNQRYR
ncbi:MAG: hypothetical protein A2987_04300 [Omnitrophica bacterium RIFCSPLOWO2_01_FULL_45_10]|nr:MAG: hypothetical protein A2987_04300 [Omnitrophica bacterium RIFCSPLOWO2_01_FULL_45_10]